MPRSGVKPRTTPAQVRDIARRHIQQFDGRDRSRAAFDFVAYMINTPEFRYSLAHLRAAVKGLELGMNEGIK